jgi:hypothetical protein
VCSRRALPPGPGHAAPTGQSAQSARQPTSLYTLQKRKEGRGMKAEYSIKVFSCVMKRVSKREWKYIFTPKKHVQKEKEYIFATVRGHYSTMAIFLTPLFHCSTLYLTSTSRKKPGKNLITSKHTYNFLYSRIN